MAIRRGRGREEGARLTTRTRIERGVKEEGTKRKQVLCVPDPFFPRPPHIFRERKGSAGGGIYLICRFSPPYSFLTTYVQYGRGPDVREVKKGRERRKNRLDRQREWRGGGAILDPTKKFLRDGGTDGERKKRKRKKKGEDICSLQSRLIECVSLSLLPPFLFSSLSRPSLWACVADLAPAPVGRGEKKNS